jgi:hypothetical protein
MRMTLLFGAILCAAAAHAGPPPDGFASSLFDKGDYRWARVEYDRLLFENGDDSMAVRWRYRFGLCSMFEGRYPQAIEAFRPLFTDTTVADSARFRAALCALHLRQIDSARIFSTGCRLDCGRLVTGYCEFADRRFDGALAALKTVPDSSPISFKARALERTVADLRDFHPKHYAPALLFSIIPGLGHCYTGRFGDALMTAITVSTGAAITGYYLYHDAKPQAYAAGTITGLLHIGGMYGAVMAVKIYNRETIQKHSESAERVLFDK